MTREELQQIKDWMMVHAVDSYQARRLVVALEAAWNERDEYKQHLARILDEQAKRRESIGIRQSPEETAFWDKAEKDDGVTREEVWEVRARKNEYDPSELRALLLKAVNALEAAWDERDQLLVERASVVDWTNTQLREHGFSEIESSRIMEDLKCAIGILSETANRYAIDRDQLKHRVRELEKERDDALKGQEVMLREIDRLHAMIICCKVCGAEMTPTVYAPCPHHV